MKEKVYTWQHVEAYSIIAIYNLLNSANDINPKNMKICIDPLYSLYKKDKAVKYANRLIKN